MSDNHPVLDRTSVGAIAELCRRGCDDPPAADELDRSLFDPARPAVVRGDPEVGVVATVVREGRGHVRLLVVDPDHRGAGAGSTLLAAAEADLAPRGPEVVVGADAPDHLWPGVPTGATALHALLERRGYERAGEICNMAVDLDRPRPPVDAERLGEADSDREEVAEWFGRHWPHWEDEGGRGAAQGTVVITRDDEGISGVCAWDVNRAGWLGPMAVRPHGDRQGVGTVLLLTALDRMAEAGHRRATVAWLGPVAFYAKAAGAEISDVFVVYRKGAD